jgi:hypothetical protein
MFKKCGFTLHQRFDILQEIQCIENKSRILVLRLFSLPIKNETLTSLIMRSIENSVAKRIQNNYGLLQGYGTRSVAFPEYFIPIPGSAKFFISDLTKKKRGTKLKIILLFHNRKS